jgi:hypothetical protein
MQLFAKGLNPFEPWNGSNDSASGEAWTIVEHFALTPGQKRVK